ncbi:hypothetical protein [Flavobacterium sp. LC2016-12]|uniref:hypothetical protein n=1 Tax=Flavobacterium sp. LC2016-12 TaxID=2783794 RepID=UPI00188A24C8|nr:hypothetical protein [Flavobacterium sp. LC2016-12]MBF4465680.1 hypothetical protein [Flavobacterium sp. LC2016-12]
MEFEQREKIVAFLKEAEKKFPVSDWKVDGIEIWPILKISIFFSNLETNKVINKNIKLYIIKFLKLLKVDFLYSFFWLKKTNIKKIDFMFSGFFGHRVLLEETFYNRYFDPIMDCLEEQGYTSSIFEYEQMKKIKHYRQNRVFDVTKFVHYFEFKTKKIEIDFEKFEEFGRLLIELENKIGTKPDTILKRVSGSFQNALVWKNLWLYVLHKNQAQKVFLLCYYDSRMYGLILAAREKNILSIDMQHGGQSDFHPGYNFNSVPVKGYRLLPDYFWTWEKSSYDNILNFTQSSSHKVIVGGNPWITSLKNKNVFLDEKRIVLYTMQTTLRPVLHSYIIDAIKNTPDNYTWWLRLHPRMLKSEIEQLHEQLNDANISDKVEIEKATNLPLPMILANCSAHISHFSGSIMEADLMNVGSNIIIGEIGKKFYKEILDEKRALYFDTNLNGNLNSLIQKSNENFQVSPVESINYYELIKSLSNDKSHT